MIIQKKSLIRYNSSIIVGVKMKIFLMFFIFGVIITGCSQKNAFTKFNMSKSQELGADSILSSKVQREDEVDGIVSVVYLNKVSPESFYRDEYFYLYYYVKNKESNVTFLLNDQEATSAEELPTSNKFSYLTSIETKWNKYYLLKFKEQGDVLKLIFKSDDFVSNPLVFEKDE